MVAVGRTAADFAAADHIAAVDHTALALQSGRTGLLPALVAAFVGSVVHNLVDRYQVAD